MNIYAEKEFVLRQIDHVLIQKMVNCPYDFFHPEVDELKENSLFVTLGGFFFKTNEDFRTRMRAIKNKSLLIIHHGKSLSINSEGGLHGYKKFIDEYNFDYSRVYFITQLKYDIDFILKIIPNINVFGYDRWLFELFDFTVFNTLFRPNDYFPSENSLPRKKFSIFCKRYEPSRLEIFCHLLVNNLLHNFNYTFVGDMFMYENKVEMINDVPEIFNQHKEKISSWLKGIPYQTVRKVNNQVFQHGHYPYELRHYFESAPIHISLETEPDNSSFITEKTYRAMFYKKPFIMISQFNALKALKAEGYRTFSPYIDESYDDIADYNERLLAVIKEIDRLNRLSLTDLEKIEEQCKEIVEHNYKILYENAYKPMPDDFRFKSMLTF